MVVSVCPSSHPYVAMAWILPIAEIIEEVAIESGFHSVITLRVQHGLQ